MLLSIISIQVFPFLFFFFFNDTATTEIYTLSLHDALPIHGAYHSSVTFAATAVAERYGIPWVIGDSVAGNITTRGFKWIFRVTPVASDFATNYMQFLNDLKQASHPINSIAIVFENT